MLIEPAASNSSSFFIIGCFPWWWNGRCNGSPAEKEHTVYTPAAGPVNCAGRYVSS